jgi:hypothetical protein
MKQKILRLTFAFFMLGSSFVLAQSSFKEVEKQRLSEEKKRNKAAKKLEKSKPKKNENLSEDLALTDKKPKGRKRGQVTKASNRLSNERNFNTQKRNNYRKGSKGAPKAAKNLRKSK